MKLSRRKFLGGLGRTGLAAWVGAELTLDALAAPSVGAAPSAGAATVPGVAEVAGTEGGILRARFLATRLTAMQEFYGQTLGWPVRRDGASLLVRAGGTELRFDPTPNDDAPYYHLAWAIPANKFEIGKAWLAGRLPLLVHPDGRDEFHFTTARRRAVYFGDPAGNVLELIARDDLGDHASGSFGLEDLLYVNHVGLVVDDMAVATHTIRGSLGLEPTAPPTPTFTKLGDAYRHVVLVPRKRLWLPEMSRGAEVFAADLVMHSPEDAELRVDPHPYRIALARSL